MIRLLTKKVPYTFYRAGYYAFSRRVPADLTQLYSYPRIVQGLKTKSAQTTKSRALVAAAKLDEYWSHLRTAAQRACTYLVEACGAKDLDGYSRADALKYRDYLIAKGMVGSSVSRVISSIRAVFNFAISEYALDLKNPFTGMYYR